METTSSDEVTRLLTAWSAGDETALEKLLPLLDDGLRKLLMPISFAKVQGTT